MILNNPPYFTELEPESAYCRECGSSGDLCKDLEAHNEDQQLEIVAFCVNCDSITCDSLTDRNGVCEDCVNEGVDYD